MKKILLVTFSSVAAAAMLGQAKRPVTMQAEDMTPRIQRLLEIRTSSEGGTMPVTPQPASPIARKTSTVSTPNWVGVTGSMNVYGVLESSGKPLQYVDELNAISFVHRKSQYYNPTPVPTPSGAATGAIVGYVSTNWGATWDSTCIWNNNTNWARYPQGGILNPVGNTSLTNAYIVGTGPVTPNAGGWTGVFLAAKKLNAFTTTASAVPGEQIFQANSSSDPNYDAAIKKVDYPSYDFTTTDDGVVRSLGIIVNDFNSTASGPNGRGFKGARILKASFVSGSVVWTSDSIFPDAHVNSNTNDLMVIGQPHMAWNDAGTVGYVWFIGELEGATGSNSGFQPIVYQSVNGSGWTRINGPDFDDPMVNGNVFNHMFATKDDTTLAIPFFNFTEGMDCTVDKNDKLHIMSTLFSTAKSHPDSVGFTWTNNLNADGETYTYQHSPGHRPYIYDFYMDPSGNGWKTVLIDSMQTESPGERSTDNGFGDNPWSIDPANGNKVQANARLLMSRTPGGSKIIYCWAESDTNRTNFGRKWNHLPNLYARVLDVNSAFQQPAYTLSSIKSNLTNLSGSAANPYIKDKATMHSISPRCAQTSSSTTNGTVTYVYSLPMKVSNNPTLNQISPITHWMTTAAIEYTVGVIDGVAENAMVVSSNLFPNPTTASAILHLDMKSGGTVKVEVLNTVGQLVFTHQVNANPGSNKIEIPSAGLAPGIYIVSARSENGTVTHKLIKD